MLVNLCCSCLRKRNISFQNINRHITSINFLFKSNPIGLGYVSPGWKQRFFSCQLKYFKVFYSLDSTESKIKSSNAIENEASNKKKPKKEIKTYITLLGVDNKVSVSTADEATKLANRRNLKLVKITDFDPKTSRPVYQLMSGSQYLKEDKEWDTSKIKKEKSIKGDKVISFSSSINEHDVLTKTKMMKKWLANRYEVRVVISGDLTSSERIYKIIEKDIEIVGRIVQKRTKGSDIRFQIIPPKKDQENKLERQS